MINTTDRLHNNELQQLVSELDKWILEDEAEIDQYLSDFCDSKSILEEIHYEIIVF